MAAREPAVAEPGANKLCDAHWYRGAGTCLRIVIVRMSDRGIPVRFFTECP